MRQPLTSAKLRLSVLTIVTTLLQHAIATGSQCYYPNGQPEGNLIPCNGTAAVSSCCAPGDTCNTNGFCKNAGDANDAFYWRDGCTDQSWGAGCPQHCTGTTFDSNAPNTNYLVRFCNASPESASDAVYCCEDNSQGNCCTIATRVFTTTAGSLYASVAIPTSTPTSSSSSSVASSSGILTSSTSSLPTSPSFPTATSASSSNQTVTGDQKNGSGGLSSGASAGIGVGVAVGVLALIGLLGGLWLWNRRKNRNMSRAVLDRPEMKSSPPPYSSDKPHEKAGLLDRSEMTESSAVLEMDASQKLVEAPGNGRHEMAQELPAEMR